MVALNFFAILSFVIAASSGDIANSLLEVFKCDTYLILAG